MLNYSIITIFSIEIVVFSNFLGFNLAFIHYFCIGITSKVARLVITSTFLEGSAEATLYTLGQVALASASLEDLSAVAAGWMAF